MDKKKNIGDILSLFEETLLPSDVLSAKLMAQVSCAITKERILKGLTQEQFAKILDVRQSQISRWESEGYNFTLEKIAEIASKLDLDVNISFTNSEISKKLPASSSSMIIKSTNKKQISYSYSTSQNDLTTAQTKEGSRYVTVR